MNSQLFSSAYIFNSQNGIFTRILRVFKCEFRALKRALGFNLSLNELESSLIYLESSVIELESSLISSFFHVIGVLAALERQHSLIQLESSLIQLQCCKWISAVSNCTHIESSLIELVSSLIQLQSSLTELESSALQLECFLNLLRIS